MACLAAGVLLKELHAAKGITMDALVAALDLVKGLVRVRGPHASVMLF